MTITILESRNEYTSTASQSVFSYTFKIFANTDLNVYVTPAGQECDDTTDLTTAYTVSGVGDEDGGAITLTTPASVGDLVTIVSSIPASRTTNYQTNGDFIPATVNDDFDRVVSLAKQVEELSNRTLTSPECRQGPKPLSLPEPVAGQLLRWNGAEDGQENAALADISPGTIFVTDLAHQYSTVLAMKADTQRTVADIGKIVKTQEHTAGYGYEGGNTYLIQAVTGGTADNGSLIKSTGSLAVEFVGLFQNGVNTAQFGANTASTAAVNTASMQAAIDYVFNTFTLGGEVFIPEGDYNLAESVLGETYDNNGSPRVSSRGCITLRSRIFLRGSGVNSVSLEPDDKEVTCIHHVSPKSGGISDLTINSSWHSSDPESNGHGIFCCDLSSDVADRVYKNVVYRNLLIANQAAYGIGLQGRPDISNVVYENLRIQNTGLDGIDTKFRGPNMVSDGCSMNNIDITAPGRRVTNNSGLDIRGRWKISNIHVHDVGSAGLITVGIRFRSYQTSAGNGPGNQAEYSQVDNFLVECNDTGNEDGVTCGSADVRILNGTIIGGEAGIDISGNAEGNPDNCIVAGVTAINQTDHGFSLGGVTEGVVMSGCVAVNSANGGFSNEAVATCLVGCTTRSTTTPYSGSVASLQSASIVGCTFPGDNYLSQDSTTDRVDLRAQGGDTNIDLRLVPKGTGVVRFGTATGLAGETLSSYITIKDSGGTSRKLGVIS